MPREKETEKKMLDTQTPLTDREAGRVRTLLELKKGKVLKLRQLVTFSPAEIAKNNTGIQAGEIARYAGRKDDDEGSK